MNADLDTLIFDPLDEDTCRRRYGWWWHRVPAIAPGGVDAYNYHTHGFRQAFGSIDIQMIGHSDPVNYYKMFGVIGTLLSTGWFGQKLEMNRDYINPLFYPSSGGRSVSFRTLPAREDGRDVMRIVVPADFNFKNPKLDDLEKPWDCQYKLLEL